MDRNVTDLDAIKKMSLADFMARSVVLTGVSEDTFAGIRVWCEDTYPDTSLINMSGHETQHGIWTIRASFEGDDAVKNAALFRIFWA